MSILYFRRAGRYPVEYRLSEIQLICWSKIVLSNPDSTLSVSALGQPWTKRARWASRITRSPGKT